ncbi:Beta-1 [Escovopsis weberi]|uniref:N-acetylgalactosaminide beta-1,3-galactosyltransferase n=1 Tax=Escovopsis weberi TaxID=150374 RepID=A0A0M8N256_ESCWE|nr:Beta-1 [Escovopsis weberi]
MALFPPPGDQQRKGLAHQLFGRLLFAGTKRLLRLLVGTAVFLGFVVLLVVLLSGHEDQLLPTPEFLDGAGFYSYNTSSDFLPVSVPQAADASTEELCDTFPHHMLEYVQPVLKVGHGDAPDKLAAQLESVSACFAPDDLLIMSDLDETFGNYTAFDVLAHLPARYYDRTYNPDIKSYLRMKELSINGLLDVDQEATDKIDGWAIDKYKFLPQIERAWRVKPNKPFYFFYETDTYIFWDAVFRFLQTFDPDAPIYMGSPSPGRVDESRNVKTWFANGGPGFALSRGAVKRLLARETSASGQFTEPSATQKWLPVLTHDCCGDSVLGWALWHSGVPLQGYWPMFNAHPLHGIPFDSPYWCQPVLSLHKTRPEDMRPLWRWEFARRTNDRPLLYADLLGYHFGGRDDVSRTGWDNGDWNGWIADDGKDIESFDACREACVADKGCVQFNWRGRDARKCLLMRTFRYGSKRDAETMMEQDGDRGGKERWVDFTAGWLGERMEQWRTKKTCDVVEWVGPSVSRVS